MPIVDDGVVLNRSGTLGDVLRGLDAYRLEVSAIDLARRFPHPLPERVLPK